MAPVNGRPFLEYILDFFKNVERSVYMKILVLLQPEFCEVAGDDIILEIKDAIQKVGVWWQ